MNWGSILSSVIPTIGSVVGSLLGANSIEDGVVTYKHGSVLGADEDFSSTFYCEDGKYYLFNQSSSSDDVVSMTFPGRGQIGAETVLVPGRQSFNVTSMFSENGRDDNNQFELTACTTSQQTTEGKASNASSDIKISSSGKGIKVGGDKQAIGSYIEVKAEQEQITVLPKNGIKISSLPMLYVQNGGETGMRVMDVQADDGSAVASLPQQLMKDDLVSVEVVANVTSDSVSNMLKLQADDDRFATPDDDMVKRIQNAPVLNWR